MLEAQVLLSRMMLEHKLSEIAKEDLLSLINCFLPKGNYILLFMFRG
jgi:hypothetical protein